MTDQKPWYLSRTIWAALATVLIGCLGLFRVPTGDVDPSALADALLDLATAAAGLLAVAGRLLARDRIG